MPVRRKPVREISVGELVNPGARRGWCRVTAVERNEGPGEHKWPLILVMVDFRGREHEIPYSGDDKLAVLG